MLRFHVFVVSTRPFAQIALSLTPLVFTPGELAINGYLYIVHRGIALFGGRVLTSGKVCVRARSVQHTRTDGLGPVVERRVLIPPPCPFHLRPPSTSVPLPPPCPFHLRAPSTSGASLSTRSAHRVGRSGARIASSARSICSGGGARGR